MSNVGSVGYNPNGCSSKVNERQGVYKVVKGETLTSIAKKFGLTYEQFKVWTGLKSDSIKIGQEIKLPMARIPDGKGLLALAKANGMTLAAFCKLNNIQETYSPKKGEMFYVWNKTQNSQSLNKPVVATASPASPTPVVQNNGMKRYSAGEALRGASSINQGISLVDKPQIPKDKNGNVVAEVVTFSPLKQGDLSGKTIMVNAGHGWGNNKKGTPVFDGGAERKDTGAQEWQLNRQLAEPLINELRNRGATVVFTSGKAKQACAAKDTGNPDLRISLHCNTGGKKSGGVWVMHNPNDNSSTEFAQLVSGNLGASYHSNTITKPDDRNLGMLRNNDVPTILCEMGFITNPADLAIIQSPDKRNEAARAITDACVEYLKK